MRQIVAALLVGVALIGGPIGPAQAQSFGIFFGDERSDFYPERITCLTDYQIRQVIADLGYRDIYLNVPNDKHVQVRASKGNWVYLIDFNYCSAHVESRKRLRPAQ